MAEEKHLNITSKGKGFSSTFREIPHNGDLGLLNPNHVKLFCLDINSNLFCYASLHEYLQKNIGSYVFSRAKIEQFKDDDAIETVGLKAVECLRTANNPKDKGAGGELGEILLYLFMEQILGAPKLLSKIELKSSNNQYVYGCDGIHLFRGSQDDEVFHQLVLGESKIIGELENAADDAFKSIAKFNLDNSTDLKLIETNIFKEAFDEQTTEYIKSLVIPSKRDLCEPLDKAFGIFLGYTPKLDRNVSNRDFRRNALQQIECDIEKVIPYIVKLIKKNTFEHNSFYFYVLPFNNAKDDRAVIINKLKGV